MNSPALLITVVVAVVAAGCSGQPPFPSLKPSPATLPAPVPTAASAKPRSDADPVAASITSLPRNVRAGDTFDVCVVLNVGAFYEIYPLDAPPPAVPTRLELSLPPSFQALGPWSAPTTTRSERAGAHRAYAGEAKFTRTIRIAPGVMPGVYDLTCSIRYQACSERLCLAPASFPLLATVVVQPP